MKALVSILVLNHRGVEDTIECVRSVLKSTYKNIEVLILDNGSGIKEFTRLKSELTNPKVKVFRSKKNLGFTGGNNLLSKKTKGKFIVLLNNDTVVDKKWLTHLLKMFVAYPNVAVVQPKIRYFYNKTYFDYAGAAGGFIDSFGYPFTRGRIFNSIEKDRGQYNKITPIFWASGAACVIKKSIIKKVGGLFKLDFFNYMEEIDFCWRIHNKGYSVFYCPSALVFHKVAATAKKYMFSKRRWEHRNNLLLLFYNLNPIEKTTKIAVRFLFEIFTYIYYLSHGHLRTVLSLFLAHVGFIIKAILYKRKAPITKDFKLLSELPIYKGSIVIDYFIKGRKLFSQLN